jgi:hypothetical protein
MVKYTKVYRRERRRQAAGAWEIKEAPLQKYCIHHMGVNRTRRSMFYATRGGLFEKTGRRQLPNRRQHFDIQRRKETVSSTYLFTVIPNRKDLRKCTTPIIEKIRAVDSTKKRKMYSVYG